MSRTRVRYQPGRKYRVDAVLRAQNPNEPDDPNDPNNRDGRKVGTLNKAYNGRTYGLKFSDGTATIDEDLWTNGTGRTPEQVLEGIQSDMPDMHVEEYGGRTLVTAPDLSHLRDESGSLRTRASQAKRAPKATPAEE